MPLFLLSLLKYWKPIGIGLVILGTFFAGVRYESLVCEQEKREIIDEFASRLQEQIDRQYEISLQYEERLADMRSEIYTISQQVDSEVVKPIYRDCKVPETGVKLLNDTVDNLNKLRKE